MVLALILACAACGWSFLRVVGGERERRLRGLAASLPPREPPADPPAGAAPAEAPRADRKPPAIAKPRAEAQ